jgi:hypothetical protein
MPRDGSGVYAQPYPSVVSGTTIESAKYNGNVTDVAQDLNTPRPIVAGGTGANNARDAMTSLQGDLAYQVVTNYDSFAFVSGSFYSAAGATSAPTGNAFTGHCYTSDPAVTPPALPASNNLYIEARDNTTGKLYVRQKAAGLWGVWSSGAAFDTDATYVNVTGDTMSGNLSISSLDPVFALNKTTSGHAGVLLAYTNNSPRWQVTLGNSVAESGSNAGSDFSIDRFNDAGVYAGSPFTIMRANGNATFAQSMTAAIVISLGAIWSIATATTGTFQFGNSGSKSLSFDGTSTFTLNGGALNLGSPGTFNPLNAGDITTSRPGAATAGAVFFGNTAGKYLLNDGTRYNFVGGNVYFGTANALVDAPVTTGTSVAGAWPVGVSSPDRGILFLSSSASNIYNYFTQGAISNSVGSITGSTTQTFYNTSSSGELKEDLKSFDAGNIIDATNVYDFKWKSTDERAYGVIAQQAIDVYPLAVTHMQVETAEGENDFWGVDYSKYVPVLLQEIKALRARVAALEGLKP